MSSADLSPTGHTAADRGSRILLPIVYFLFATPFQAIFWFLSSMGEKYIGWHLILNCGQYLEAAVILVVLTILRLRFAPVGSRMGPGEPWRIRTLFIVYGVVAGLTTSLVWWHLFRLASAHSGQQDYIFGLHRFGPGYYPGNFQSSISYFCYSSVFIAILIGIICGDQAARRPVGLSLFNWSPPEAVGSPAAFVWHSWVAWLAIFHLVQISLMLLVAPFGNNWRPVNNTYVGDAPLFASLLACFPISYWLSRRTPKTRKSSIRISQAASFMVLTIATLLLVPFGFVAFTVFGMTIFTLNAAGFAWGWIAGDLRWRSLQLQKSAQTTN